MKPFNRLSVILGSIISICLLLVFENLIGMAFFCPPHKLVLDFGVLMIQVHRLPASFYAVTLCCNCIAYYLGGMLPVIIADEKLKRSVLIGLIVSLFAVLYAVISPFPIWYKVLSACLCIPFASLGGLLTKKLFES